MKTSDLMTMLNRIKILLFVPVYVVIALAIIFCNVLIDLGHAVVQGLYTRHQVPQKTAVRQGTDVHSFDPEPVRS